MIYITDVVQTDIFTDFNSFIHAVFAIIFQACLWIKDKYLEELVKYEQTTEKASEASHEEKHHEL